MIRQSRPASVQSVAASRAECVALDEDDPLATLRELYTLPEALVYLDGNSLGPLPKEAAARLQRSVHEAWGHGLIRSWNSAGWIELPMRVGAKIARLVGAEPDEVVAADSTSVNLFKVLSAALRLRPGRRVIVSERGNFPTDLYVAQGLIGQLGAGHELRLVDRDAIGDAIDATTAVVMLTQVDYRSGSRLDIAEITARAHAAGALTIWDLAHSAGAFEVGLNEARADLAIGCGYKYLNGGPGAPAFVFVAKRHQARFEQPLSGWMGHAAPFAFEASYRGASGIARALCGTPPVLSLVALEAGVDAMLACEPLGGLAATAAQVARAGRPVHRAGRGALRRPRSAAGHAARARGARQPGEFRARRWRPGLRGGAGADRSRRHRRLPRAGHPALRHRAQLPAPRRHLGRGRAA